MSPTPKPGVANRQVLVAGVWSAGNEPGELMAASMDEALGADHGKDSTPCTVMRLWRAGDGLVIAERHSGMRILRYPCTTCSLVVQLGASAGNVFALSGWQMAVTAVKADSVELLSQRKVIMPSRHPCRWCPWILPV